MLNEAGTIWFEHEKVFEIIGIKSLTFIFQSFCLNLNFKSTDKIFLGKNLTMAASVNMFYIAINYDNKTNVKVAASNINIKMHQLFSKLRILRVRVTIAQRGISVELTRTCS